LSGSESEKQKGWERKRRKDKISGEKSAREKDLVGELKQEYKQI